MKKQNNNEDKVYYLPIFMSIGISIGVAIGAAIGNIPVAMCIGLGLGVCIGAAMDAKNRAEEDKTDQKDEEKE